MAVRNGFQLSAFRGTGYDKGRPVLTQAAWFAVQNLVFGTWWCPARLRVTLLRLFGARVGNGVLIRHRVRVLWPWKLSIGDDCWIGEGVWLLNLEPIRLGSDVCLSQEAFLCTGSHLFDSPSFEFDNAPISVGDGTWVAAQALVLRGVGVGRSCRIGARAVITRDVPDGARVSANARY